jgi:DNA-binding beta-propeller fold protein YncE
VEYFGGYKLIVAGLSVAAFLSAAAGCSNTSPESDAFDGITPYADQRPLLRVPGRTLAYIANRASDSVSVVDLDAFEVVGAAPVGRDPVDLDGPRHIVLDAKRGVGYLLLTYPDSNQFTHATSQSDNGRAGYIAAYSLRDLRPLGDLRVNVSPGDIALSDSKRALAVSHFDQRKGLMTDPEARWANIALAAPAPGISSGDAQLLEMPVCAVSATLMYVREDSRVFVVCTGEDILAVLDAESGAILAKVPTGDLAANKPYAMARNLAGDKVLISNQVARTVVLFSTDDTPVALATATVNGVPFFAEFLDDQEYVVALQDPGSAARIDAASSVVLAQATYEPAVCTKPSAFKRAPDGRLFLVCEGDHHRPGSLVEVDPQTLVALQSLELGVYPERLEILSP